MKDINHEVKIAAGSPLESGDANEMRYLIPHNTHGITLELKGDMPDNKFQYMYDIALRDLVDPLYGNVIRNTIYVNIIYDNGYILVTLILGSIVDLRSARICLYGRTTLTATISNNCDTDAELTITRFQY